MVFGKNILENITTGMYYDSKVIYREYIQNACDQIDLAVKEGILSSAAEGKVDIDIDVRNRRITISDNATGIAEVDFRRQLENIADSDKELGVNKGFRGIGRLCGLAYCKTLTFCSTYLGETTRSIMTIDAQTMRDMIASPQKYSAEEILNKITKFTSAPASADEHGFVVCLDDINKENTALLDKEKVEAYLCFVAPVPYSNKFILRSKIYAHAQEIGYPIDEYNIYVGGNQIFKEYGMRLYSKSNLSGSKQVYDQFSDVAFYDIKKGNELIAWMWYGLSRFEKAIPKADNPMYGFRVRQGNIQIGENTILAKFFKEDRGNSYFVGEVFAVSPLLIPNSKRDNFNENETRNYFEQEIQRYCYDQLNRLYNSAAKLKSAFQRLSEYSSAVEELEKKTVSGFVDDKEKADLTRKVVEAEQKKDEAKKIIAKIPSGELAVNEPLTIVQKSIKEHFDKKEIEKKASKAEKKQSTIVTTQTEKPKYFTDSLSKLDKRSRKLVAQVMGVVSKHTDETTLNAIKADIEKEFR